MNDQPEIQRRVNAAGATLNEFRGKAFRLGERDCVRMVAAHLRRLGYQVKLPARGSYRSRKAGLAELAKRGFADLPAALDAYGLTRIAPAAALVGDILQLPGEAPGALVIVLGNGRVVGYHEHARGAAVLQPVEAPIAAWRVKA